MRVRCGGALHLAQRSPRGGHIHILQRLVRSRRSIAADRQCRTGIDEFSVRESAFVAIFAEECRPGFQEDGVCVGWLDGSGDTCGCEALAVAWGCEFEVLDAVAVAGRAEVREGVTAGLRGRLFGLPLLGRRGTRRRAQRLRRLCRVRAGRRCRSRRRRRT
jgi:hypothetical protein